MEETVAQDVHGPLFGKYEIGKLLGCGGFAKVYHARNVHSGQSVAIKCINKQRVLKNGMSSQIKREIAIMRRMHHQNIVKLFEVLATKTKIYFVMEFVKGGELFNKVAKGHLTEDASRRYFRQIISAVGYCHSLGVFHRDLKPENILLDDKGDLKVSDFGLSAVTEQTRNDGMLHTLCGTPAYVAPEILGKKGYDGAKVDIWSCGVILYILNAGYLPFNNYSLIVMYRKIYKGEFQCPKWMSPDLRRFLSRLLDPNSNTRITFEGILHDPWFSKGCYSKESRFDEECFDLGCTSPAKQGQKGSFLNAFDIISFSSGLDLSGLFHSSVKGERYVLEEAPHVIIARIEEMGKKENMNIARKEWQLGLGGQNGNIVAAIEVCRLTANLVVVEVKSHEEMWREKLRKLIYQRDCLGPLN